MSLCYDGEKWLMITFASVAISLSVGLILQYAHGQSDVYLEGKVKNDTSITGKHLQITKLEIQNRSQICPSLQCKIDYKDKNTYFNPPTLQELYIGFQANFRLQDDITNADLGPIKKEAIEQYSLINSACRVDDIIEDNGQEIYICHDNSTIMLNEFDRTYYVMDTTEIYDAKNGILKISGNSTGDKIK